MEEKIPVGVLPVPYPPATIPPEAQKYTTRRSRKDEEGRDYQCGCGKRYLSYPALYTHIKTKHDGIQPQGTLKTGTAQITKRTKAKLQEQTLKSILIYSNDFESQVLIQLGQTAKGSVSVNSRIKKDSVSKQLYDQFTQMIKQHQIKLSDQSSLEMVLLVFLINMGEIVNDKVYQQYLLFAKLARACYHEHGEEIHRAIYTKKNTGPFIVKEFHANCVKYFPLVIDFLIRFYIPETETKDTREANLSMMEIIGFDFCRWMISHKLTTVTVGTTRSTEIDFKPPVTIKIKTTPGKVQSQKDNEEKEMKQKQEDSEQVSEEVEQVEDEPEQEEEKNVSISKEVEQE